MGQSVYDKTQIVVLFRKNVCLCVYFVLEFDQFLEERISAGERLPLVKPAAAAGEESQQAPTTAAPGTPQRNANTTRQMHKDDSENALFAL